ncbi:MAG TPA: hypothetical protein VK909_10670 [Anaerolineales bacterium]|nr:hypothetical protein [Anaerolineales bacterium]
MKLLALSPSVLRKLNLLASFSFCLVSSFFALKKLDYPLIGIDDANIYFVYARNFANGHGFVYNVGGERVEGFTSFLWTLISALAFKLSTYPELTLLIINILLVSLGIACALHYLQDALAEGGKNRRATVFWSALYLILVFTSPRYIVWNTITLMENALWSTLLLLTTLFSIRRELSPRAINLQFIPLAILLIVTRPESIVWVAVFILILFLRISSQSNYLYALKTLVPSILSTTVALGLLTVFRIYYFGYLLPNTFYAKVSPSFTYDLQQGTIYLGRYFMTDPIAAVSIVLIFFACIRSLLRPMPARPTFFLPFLAATGLLIPLLTGGDHFGSFRFYQNIYPITILSSIFTVQSIFSELSRNLRLVSRSPGYRTGLASIVALSLIVGFVLSQNHAWSRFVSEIDAEFNVAKYERENGFFIEDLFSSLPQLPSIGVIASGGIKYSYNGEIIDLFGLNNTVMAHNHGERIGYKNHAAFEVKTFFQLEPDIVWPIHVDNSWRYSEQELRDRWENTLGFKGLFNDPRFLELYEYAKVSQKSNQKTGIALVAWFKKDLVKLLISKPNFLVEEYEYNP